MEEGHWRCDLVGETEELHGKPQILHATLQANHSLRRAGLLSHLILLPTTSDAQPQPLPLGTEIALQC